MALLTPKGIRAILDREHAWRRTVRRRLRAGESPADILASLFRERRARRTSSLAGESSVDPDIDQAGIVHECARQLGSDSASPSDGVVYTPAVVARAVVESARPGAPGRGSIPSILDPACGCGVFLLEAYRHIARRRSPRSPDEAQAILDRLCGWDLDEAAVQIAVRTLRFAAWESLPDPGAAMPEDFSVPQLYVGDPLQELDGQFDWILGNPPFIPEEDHRVLLEGPRSREKWRMWLQPRMDYGQFFIHLALGHLAPDGLLAFIVSESWQTADSASRLRDRLHAAGGELKWEPIGDLRPFRATAPGLHPAVLRLDQGRKPAPVAPPSESPAGGTVLGDLFEIRQGLVAGPDVLGPKARRRLAREWPEGYRAWHEIYGATKDEGAPGVFVLTREEIEALDLQPRECELLRPFFKPSDLENGQLPDEPARWILYLTRETAPSLESLPNIRRHLEGFRPFLERRRETRNGLREWFHLHWPREPSLFDDPDDQEKVLVVRQTPTPCAVWTEGAAYVDLGFNIIRRGAGPCDLRGLADYLNSPEAHAWLRTHGKRKGKVLQVDGSVLRRMPLPPSLAVG